MADEAEPAPPRGADALEALMARAVALGETSRRVAPPNPWVGCVLVRDGVVVGEGATASPGAPHAEVVALVAAGDRAQGATAVVTLEPCAHHGRTGPCAEALIAAGVTHVVAGVEDPDPRVRGQGIAALRAAGVEVTLGVNRRAVSTSLAPYLHHRRTGRAWCVLKTASSLDGRSAAPDGSSQWITGPEARADAHRLRAESQAVMVGAGTAATDLPTLTPRDVAPPLDRDPPLRVVCDRAGRLLAEGPLFDPEIAPTLVLTTEAAPPAARDAWQAAGAKVEVLPAHPATGGVDLAAGLAVLGGHQVLQVLVEGGATLHASLLAAGLVDQLVAYVGGVALGRDARPLFDWPAARTIADAPRFTLVDVTRLGGDARLTYEPARP